MALTGLQIQKLLPKTNCKECGSNTCMAFAMKLAQKKVELSACPYVSEEAKEVLGAQSEPPVKSLELGKDGELKLGGETCLYRHEKTFVNQTAFAVNINDTDSPEDVRKTLEAVRDYVLERVGESLCVEMVSVTQLGSDRHSFVSLSQLAWDITKRPLVLRSTDSEALVEAAGVFEGSRSIICCPDLESAAKLSTAAAEHGHALCITAPDIDALGGLSQALKSAGFDDLILNFTANSLAEQFQLNSIARSAALRDSFKPLGYPGLRFIESGDVLSNAVLVVTEIAKYGGVCVLPSFDRAELSALMTLRQNIFTDPQKPIQVEPKAYEIGEPKPDSPVFVTTNFSLTYFLVSGEIENSGTSAWLLVPECEGMSVLTAWAAGKFSGASIAKFVKETDFENRVSCRQMVIPGYVAQISGEIEEGLPGWKVLVGPQEAADIESFVKSKFS